MLVAGILVSLGYDLLWFILKTGETAAEGNEAADGGVE